MPNQIENLLNPLKDNFSFAQICGAENLYAAWRKVRANRGAGGVDAVSLKDFEKNLRDNLEELSRNLLNDTYQPLPVKFVQVMKANGKMRELGILTVRDRTAQRAVLDAIEPNLESLMKDCSFAFRAGRNLEMAIQQILVARANGFWWTVEADIENYFGSINREILLRDVRRIISDENILHLIELWLNTGILEETWWQAGNKKIAQANAVIHEAVTEGLENLVAQRYGAQDDLANFSDGFDEPHVKQIVLVGNINLTTPVVSFCLEKQIEVVFLSQGGKFRGRLNGDASRSVEVRRQQYERASDAAFCLQQAKRFVAGKITNQLVVARQQAKNASSPKDFTTLKNLLRKTETVASIESLLGIEGAASAVYFRLFAGWIPQPWSFPKRTANPPRDEINALLSLSYTLLYNRIATHLNMIGLDAYQGFFHQTRNGHAALASDLLEEFRPVVADALVLKLIRRKQLNLSEFEREKGKICLTDAGKKIFFAEFENKLGSKRQTSAGDNWSLSYAKIIERQAHHFARVITGEEAHYQPFVIR